MLKLGRRIMSGYGKSGVHMLRMIGSNTARHGEIMGRRTCKTTPAILASEPN